MKNPARSTTGRTSTRKSGAIWWLPLTSFLLSTATQQGEAMIATPNVELSTMGYDPLLTDVMERLDQAIKGKIFTATQRDPIYVEKREDVLNNFVCEVQHSRCSPCFTEAVAHTYEEYKSLATAAISFITEMDATTPLGAAEFNFKDKAGYGNLNNPNAVYIRHFFNQSEREVRLVKVECVTHTVSIIPVHEPVFTTGFKSALHNLHETAMDTNSEIRKKVFSQFVRSYGTHFARTTHFGYAAYFGKLFASQAKTTAEEAVRRRCMMESARETLTPGARRWCETTGNHFSRVVAAKCGEEEVDELVIETGSASVSDAGDCDLATKESPRPVAYILEKISALFQETWISAQTLDTSQVKLNATALSALFKEQLGEYSQDVIKKAQDVIEKAETPSRKQCPWRRFITPNLTAAVTELSEAEDKTSSVVKGPIIIVGGRISSGAPATPYSIALFAPAPPPFPVSVRANTVARLGTKIYSCGGEDSKRNKYKKCWVMDTGTPNATWNSFNIEWELTHHSAVVVQEEMWLFSNSKLMILQTRNGTNTFREIDLGFSFGSRTCVVTHGSQTFVIGVGGGQGGVYINNDNRKPEQWERFSMLQEGRHDFGCIVFAGKVIVTGGVSARTTSRLSSFEAISVVDGTVRTLTPLSGQRRYHQMAIIHGRPVVLGGFDGSAVVTIETYDGLKDSWETLGYSLSQPRFYFGLTQYFP